MSDNGNLFKKVVGIDYLRSEAVKEHFYCVIIFPGNILNVNDLYR